MRKRPSAPYCLALALTMLGSTASAQTWSERRQRPALFEIVAVDETAQTSWPFGREDIASDGESTVMPDEAAADLRSIYADARAGKLWLRAYVTATTAPAMADTIVFFFINTDARATTGGRADVMNLFPEAQLGMIDDGFERAVAISGDGMLFGVFFWDDTAKTWMEQPDRPILVTPEVGVARDPLRLAGDDHGYFQAQLELPAFELDEACDGTIFVRTINRVTGARRFYDYALPADCRGRFDAAGLPEILVATACDDDAVCPARGSCEDRRCTFEYECTQNSECRAGQRCSGGTCTGTAAGSGGRSGSAGSGGSGGSDGDESDGGDGAIEGEKVRGGALACAARSGSVGGGAWFAGLSLLAAWVYTRSRRRGGR